MTTPNKTQLVKATLATQISPAQITSDQDNYSPTGWGTSDEVRLYTDASRTVTGFAAPTGTEQTRKTIINIDSNDLILANESASSTSANRILTGTGSNLTISAGQAISISYDTTSSRWRVISSPSTGGGGGGGNVFISGWTTVNTFLTLFTSVGGLTVDTSTFAGTYTFKAVVDAPVGYSAEVRLYDIIGDTVVSGSTLTSTSGTSAPEILSATVSLTGEKAYDVQLRITPDGGPGIVATCRSAGILVEV